MRLQGPWAPRDGTCGHAIRTGSWSKRGCGSRPAGAERWRSLPDREQHRVAQPERICLARGNTDLVSPTIGVQRFRHHGRDEMARPMPLEDSVVELDLRDPSIQGLVHPDPDRRPAAPLYVEGIAGRGLAWPPNGKDRKSVVVGKRRAVRVDTGGRRLIKNKT